MPCHFTEKPLRITNFQPQSSHTSPLFKNNNDNNNNNDKACSLEILGWHPAGHSQVLRADEVLFSLGGQSSRDGVSTKIPMAV